MGEKRKSNFGIGLLLGLIIGLIVTAMVVIIFVIKYKTQEALKNENQRSEVKPNQETNVDVEANNNTLEEKKSFNDTEIEKALQNYLDLKGALNNQPDAVLRVLFGEANVEVDSSDTSVEYYLKTNIQYEEFKNKILDYMTEEEFNRFNTDYSGKDNFKNENGLLYVLNTGASGDHWNVDSIEKLGDNKYIGHTTWMFEGLEETKKNVYFEFSIKDNNNKCVIDSLENKIENNKDEEKITEAKEGKEIVEEYEELKSNSLKKDDVLFITKAIKNEDETYTLYGVLYEHDDENVNHAQINDRWILTNKRYSINLAKDLKCITDYENEYNTVDDVFSNYADAEPEDSSNPSYLHCFKFIFENNVCVEMVNVITGGI